MVLLNISSKDLLKLINNNLVQKSSPKEMVHHNLQKSKSFIPFKNKFTFQTDHKICY
jgi:hypothetical protein